MNALRPYGRVPFAAAGPWAAGRHHTLKRIFDIVVVLAVLPLVIPVALICALAVRLDSPGPVIMRQSRTGQHGHQFKMYKFRTMVANAEELKASLAHLNILPPPDFKIPNDPRITRVGRFLRKSSLDELPQLLNVLVGDMSLVGPRPTSFAASTYRLWHMERLVRPDHGIWQVRARGTSTFDGGSGWTSNSRITCPSCSTSRSSCSAVGSLLRRTGA